jgi:type I site-specific restriction endonuclease
MPRKISEEHTRKEMIDPQLEQAGWYLRDYSNAKIWKICCTFARMRSRLAPSKSITRLLTLYQDFAAPTSTKRFAAWERPLSTGNANP